MGSISDRLPNTITQFLADYLTARVNISGFGVVCVPHMREARQARCASPPSAFDQFSSVELKVTVILGPACVWQTIIHNQQPVFTNLTCITPLLHYEWHAQKMVLGFFFEIQESETHHHAPRWVP